MMSYVSFYVLWSLKTASIQLLNSGLCQKDKVDAMNWTQGTWPGLSHQCADHCIMATGQPSTSPHSPLYVELFAYT